MLKFPQYENHEREWREEENRLRWERQMERRLTNRDPFYPDYLHEQDVAGIEEDESE